MSSIPSPQNDKRGGKSAKSWAESKLKRIDGDN